MIKTPRLKNVAVFFQKKKKGVLKISDEYLPAEQ